MSRLALVALLLAAPAAAHADLLSLRVEAHGGGAGGVGVGGDQKDNAFQAGARGGAYGALVGAELLFIDGWVSHQQYNDGALIGTWTQFMLGMDVDVDLGVPTAPPGYHGSSNSSVATMRSLVTTSRYTPPMLIFMFSRPSQP